MTKYNHITVNMSIEHKRPTLRDVCKYVVPKYAHEWKYLGALLDFDQAELDIILTDSHHISKDCCRMLLSTWLERNSVASWDQLLLAIDNLAYQGMKL